ncbi:Acyl-coenzyme A:6-aminopenicillanic acid acyl-transferase [Capnocytophaga haemolytica]|nr:Acyl-coenzyme A:6-aminopenicillanic acid acyl-transferase [Capnocytophaga haemolytica]SNV08113.1 Predicted choloylglycine hydrolase [Capnocytophaga haemolytica]
MLLTSCGIFYKKITPPEVSYTYTIPQVNTVGDSLCYFEDNYLIRNRQQLWELYLSGNPYQLGLNSGALTQRLYHRQDSLLFTKLNDFVPSVRKQRFLRRFIKWFNRDINNCIIPPLKEELLGQSRYSDTLFNYIAPPYERALYLHSAHDLGHALQDLMLVGCSSLAVWGDYTADGQLLIGRNFDFYLSDDFATERIVRFVRPDKGIPFMSYAWGGMVGVLSGMNLEGLTVTINAGKSSIPLRARTPISLLCREILQYASTIDEAVAIAKKRKVFVSEAIMVGSAKDKRAVLIEVSPKKIGIYEVENRLLCTNHFQSDVYKDDKKNKAQIAESHSAYRYAKLEELVPANARLTPEKMAAILRNTEGLEGKAIGYGNEKALNQLLAHHAVIFKPEQRKVWVSSSPYQLGEFVMYDLKEVFKDSVGSPYHAYRQSEENIAADAFKDSEAFAAYEAYRSLEQQVEASLRNDKPVDKSLWDRLITLNHNYWKAYYLAGRAAYQQRAYAEALSYFKQALGKEIPYVSEQRKIEVYIKKCKKKI